MDGAGETDWHRVVALYDALVELTQSPVVELNRAVALSMASGPAAARAEFERAAALTENTRERALLLGRAKALGTRRPS